MNNTAQKRPYMGEVGFIGAVLLLLCSIPIPATAQDFAPPLIGPLVAYTDAPRDAILLYDTATGLTRRLSFGSGPHTVWDFSPDGCRVLFTRGLLGGVTAVYSARLDGSEVRELVDTSALPGDIWDLWEPDWSPDGARIALTLSRAVAEGERESRVGWIPTSGGTPEFYSVAGDEHSPRWSPTGDWLAYISYEPRPAGATIYATAEPSVAGAAPTLREADLWIVTADGLTKERITRFDVGSATRPRWNPAGDLLAFTYSPQPGDNQLWMIAAQPEAIPTQLNFEWHQALALTWDPSGERLIYAARGFRGESAARLWSVPLIGNADTDAVPALADVGLGAVAVDYPRFSPDGTRLAFRQNYNLAILDRATGDLTHVEGSGNTPPVWSPAAFAGESACS